LRTLTRKSKDDDGKVVASPSYPAEKLRKRYKEPTRSQAFIDRCILIADCCLALEQENAANEAEGKKLRYYYQTEAAYSLERSYYHFVLDMDDGLIHPHLIFCQDKLNKDGKEEATLESYILEVFDPTLPRYRMKKRLGDYVKFLDDEGDERQEQTDTEKLPILLFVCPRMTDLIYAKRRARKLVADAWYWEDDEVERPRIRFTTIDKLKQSGLLAIWEQA
jgi:hypothetical protein